MRVPVVKLHICLVDLLNLRFVALRHRDEVAFADRHFLGFVFRHLVPLSTKHVVASAEHGIAESAKRALPVRSWHGILAETFQEGLVILRGDRVLRVCVLTGCAGFTGLT